MPVADFQICAAGDVDAPAISILSQEAIRRTNAQDYTATEIDAVCMSHSIACVVEFMKRRHVVVLKYQDQIVGTVSLEKDKLHSLFVSPDCQGLGYGTALVVYIEEYAAKLGLDRICLSSSITAQRFYAGLGYKFEMRENRPIGTTYLMAKAI